MWQPQWLDQLTGGWLTEEASGFIARATVRNDRVSDFRNPERIAAWSRTIAAQLRSDRTEAAV
jgi:hypothetical protein